MADIGTVLLAFIVLASAYLVFKRQRKCNGKKMPPQPPGLPILGNLLSLKANIHEAYFRFMKYGDVCTVRVGPSSIVVLNTYEAVKEALIDKADVFSGRPRSELMDGVVRGSGVAFIDGPVWKEHRRFILRTLKELGVGKSTIEDIIRDEAAFLVESLQQHAGKPLNSLEVFTPTVCNVISRLIFRERLGTDDPKFRVFTDGLDIVVSTAPVVFLPMIKWLMRIPFVSRLLKIREFLCAWDNMHECIIERINKRLSEIEATNTMPSDLSEANDICDFHLMEKSKRDAADKENHSFTDFQIVRNLLEIFGAGIDTSISTFSWMMLLLSINPKIHVKMRKEIEANIGLDQLPKTEDRAVLPYACAVLDELLRYTSVLPVNLPHRTFQDTELMGYFIPADTVIQTNLYAIHHDPKSWERPFEFYPEHFLTSDGQYCPSKYLIPFSIGKRACAGEALGKAQLFILMVTITQHFNMRLEANEKNIDEILKGSLGISLRPLDHRIVFSKPDSDD